MEIKLSDMTMKDWVVWQWDEVSAMGADDRTFIRGFKRTPDEAMNAAEEWACLESFLNDDNQEDKPEKGE